MIHFSFSSVLMTILIGNLMMVILAVCFRSDKVMEGIGYKLMTVLCIMTLARLLVPLELPFTRTIYLPETVSRMLVAVRHPFGSFLGINLSLWTAFCVIWLIAAIVFWVIFSGAHGTIRSFTGKYGKDVTTEEPYASILTGLCSEELRGRIRIITSDEVDSPMISGLLRPRIMLPLDVDVSDDDTLYAIKHEIRHYAHRDLWIMAATKFLTLVYWWNPCFRQLNRRVHTVLEMRIDDDIMKEGSSEAEKYVLSLYRYVTSANCKPKADDCTASLCSQERSILHQRIRMMRRHDEKKSCLPGIAMLLVMACLYIGSYLVILEPAYYGPEIQEDYFVTKDNVFAVENEYGRYTIYKNNGDFLDIAESLQYYHWSIPVYSSKEEYLEKTQ